MNWVSIGPGNGLSPDLRHAIIWTNAGILLIGPHGTHFSVFEFEFESKFKAFHSWKSIWICRLRNGGHFVQGGGGGVSLTTTKLWVWVNNYIQLTQWDVHAWPYMNVNGKLSWGSYWCNRFTSPYLNTLRPRQNGRHFLDDTIKRIFLNENIRISIEISLKFVPKGPINEIPALVQIMAWRRPGDKPLSELMMVNLPTHICVSRPQWFNLRFFCVIQNQPPGTSFTYMV